MNLEKYTTEELTFFYKLSKSAIKSEIDKREHSPIRPIVGHVYYDTFSDELIKIESLDMGISYRTVGINRDDRLYRITSGYVDKDKLSDFCLNFVEVDASIFDDTDKSINTYKENLDGLKTELYNSLLKIFQERIWKK